MDHAEVPHLDIAISINVHEKPEYLLNQISNINQHVKLEKAIILNCNEYMYREMSSRAMPSNVILNPDFFEKRRHHGSLTKGIVSNMRYMMKRYNFKYFLVMSSREFFYRELTNTRDIESNIVTTKYKDYNKNDWHWPTMKRTKLFRYIQDQGLYFSMSAHEGMCFNGSSCQYILNFLRKHPDIEEDINSFEECLEEMAIQTICCNFSEFYYLGNGIDEIPVKALDMTKFTVKRRR